MISPNPWFRFQRVKRIKSKIICLFSFIEKSKIKEREFSFLEFVPPALFWERFSASLAFSLPLSQIKNLNFRKTSIFNLQKHSSLLPRISFYFLLLSFSLIVNLIGHFSSGNQIHLKLQFFNSFSTHLFLSMISLFIYVNTIGLCDQHLQRKLKFIILKKS